MLVLSRKKDETIIIGDNIKIMVIDIRKDKVRLGIEAPKDVSVHRQEVWEAIQRERQQQQAQQPPTEENATESNSQPEQNSEVSAE